MAQCSTCSASIIWVVTAGGKKMPINTLPVDNGNIIFDGPNPDSVRVLKKTEQGDLFLAGKQRFVSHFATCKFARQHRKAPDA